MILNIVICDDDKGFAEEMEKRASKILDDNEYKYHIVILHSGRELMEYFKTNSSDIVLTDIDMGNFYDPRITKEHGVDGFEAVKVLQETIPEAEVIFVTAHEELAYQSYRYKPFSFVSKRELSMLDEDLKELARKVMLKKNSNTLFPLLADGKTYIINTSEIIYFKSDRHYICAYTMAGKADSYRCGTREAYEQLSSANFIYVHRSYLINCRYIKYFDTGKVIMLNGEKINITRDTARLREAHLIFSKYRRSLQ